MNQVLPTSNFEIFRQQLLNPNTSFSDLKQEDKIMKINKNLVISYVSDSTGCGHIRNIFPMTYMNSIFGKTGRFNTIISPVMLFQHDMLVRTRSIFFQRTMAPGHIPAVNQYKQMQSKYGYKMIYDIDDFIWKGDDIGEEIPEYNFGSEGIGDDVRQASLDVMNMMDIVCVSTEFLGNYIKSKGVTSNIIVVPNAIPQYFWGPQRKRPIKEKLKKPRVIYSGSPTHYHQIKRLKGDWDNAWCDWVIKNVKDNKIDFCCMGGLPFFFEGIKDKIKVINWVNSFQYHLAIKQYKPDFGLSPLVPNYFNYSKSFIKYQEYCAIGALGIGTVFTNGKPSPYEVCQIKAPDNITVEQIDEMFEKYLEPELYNTTLKAQYKQIDELGWWLESEDYIKRWTDIL
jgi:hypothetical protein